MFSLHALPRLLALSLAAALIGFSSARAENLSLPPTGSAVGAFLSSSHEYPGVGRAEERHFSYRVPQALVNEPAGTVPIVLLLHGGVPTGTPDQGFMRDFLDGVDERASPGSDFAYIAVRAAEPKAARCQELFQAGHIDEDGRRVCLDSAVVGRVPWRFVGSSASSGGVIDAPDAFTVNDPDAYVDVVTLAAIVQDFADTFPSLDRNRVFIATFSFGSHVADQVLCSRASMVRGVASITGSWLTRRQFGADGVLGGADATTECGSGNEPGYAALTGGPSDAYGRRDATGKLSKRGTLRNRVPVFRSLGLADHNVTEGQTATEAAQNMARLNGVGNTAGKITVLPDVNPATDDGKVITLAPRRTPRAGETRATAKALVIGECGLQNKRGGPAFNPRKVPSVDGRGCTHGIWGNNDNEDVGTDQHWPRLAIEFFAAL